jgi:RNA 2',3'-cyclic 3'-phosphodiesterase
MTVPQAGGRTVAQADLHLTLCFLGAVDESALAALLTRASHLAAAAFSLQFDRIEYWRESRVMVAVASQAPSHGWALVRALQSVTGELGLSPDLKPWRPHVTLARGIARRRVPAELLSGLPLAPDSAWPVDRFHLAESRRADGHVRVEGKSRYTLLGSWPLRSAP